MKHVLPKFRRPVAQMAVALPCNMEKEAISTAKNGSVIQTPMLSQGLCLKLWGHAYLEALLSLFCPVSISRQPL